MSIKWIGHYWEDGPREVKQRYVLVAIADNANDEGYAYPSVDRIAKKTLIPKRTVQRIISNLETAGWLDRTLRGAEKPQKSGQKTTGYQLHWKPESKTKGCQIDTSLPVEGVPNETPKGCQIGHEGVPNEAAPLMYLTVNESSGNRKAFTETLSGEKAAKGAHPTPPSPPVVEPPPEARTLVDLLVCASPWAVLRSMRVSDVQPEHRIPVIEAYKHEARDAGISKMQALEGLLRVVEAQVTALPRDELRFLGDIKTYFGKRNYRIGTHELTGGGANGKFKGKGRAIEDSLREFFGGSGDTGGVGTHGLEAGGRPRPDDAKTLHRRLG